MMYVRTVGERDLEAVRALLAETWHATYDPIYGSAKIAAITAEWHSIPALKARLSAPRSEFVLAEDAEGVAGMAFAAAEPGGETVVLRQLYVLPARQGGGVGGLLLREMLDCFPEARAMRLEVDPGNPRAIAFYEAWGFGLVGRTENCGRDQSGLPALIYEKRLG